MIDKPNLKNMTKKIKKAPTFKYGIEITKPFSTAMYDHNDQCAQEMKKNILTVWTNELLKMKEYCDVNAMTADWDAYDIKSIAPKLLAIQKGVQAIGYGSGYSLDMVDKEFRNELETMANWQLHENYSYLCFENLVPRTTFMMVGFGWEKCEYDGRIVANSELTSDFAPFEGEIELDMQMANESENIQ